MTDLKHKLTKTPIQECVFSYFKCPIHNTIPYSDVSLFEVYTVINGEYFKQKTEMLKKVTDKKQARIFKSQNFDYVTFSGIFNNRHNSAIIKHSQLMVIDLDHLSNIKNTKYLLLSDTQIETQLLFTSPSGDGLKWVVKIDLDIATHLQYFIGLKNYLYKTYNLVVDSSGKDISRACFIPHDPNVYINPKLINNGF